MDKNMTKLLATLLLSILCLGVFGAESNQVKYAASSGDWWTDFSITPFAALNHPNLTDGPRWGVGLDIGYNLNPTVSLHLSNLGYESNPQSGVRNEQRFNRDLHNWGGPAIDETSLLLRADLIGHSKERFVLYGIGGADRSWETEDWGFSVGVGAEIRLSKNVSLGADARVRAWFKQEKDLLTRGFLSFRF